MAAMNASEIKGLLVAYRPLGAALAAASALLLVAGCSLGKSEEPSLCPAVSILSDAAKMTRFRPGNGRDITDVQLQAELTSYHGSCQYDAKAKQMNVVLRIGVDAQLGPGATSRNTDLAYFVALPAFYPKPQAKQIMSVPLAFPKNTDHVRYTDEEVRISFPVADLKELGKYSVILGLQLTPEEVEYNRRQTAGG
jgi:hypothetical protein